MRLIAILLCFALIVCAAPAAAQTAIHRCIGANGNPLFTDQPCAALQATALSPVAKPGNAGDAGNFAGPPPILCAATLGELKQSVIEAFASHDANRMAGLMLWSGYGRGAAVADIRALGVAMRQTLLDFGPEDSTSTDADPLAPAASSDDNPFAPSAPLTPPAASPAGNRLVLHTTGNDGSGSPRALRFAIVRRSGCLWLRNAD